MEVVIIAFPELTVPDPIAFPELSELAESKGIVFINVKDLILDMAPQDRIVNLVDHHPSVEVHRRLAEELTILLSHHSNLYGYGNILLMSSTVNHAILVDESYSSVT